MKYRTRDNDVLDQICFRRYGKTARYLELVLEANPDLCYYPARLPAGIVIDLPDLSDTLVKRDIVRLWD